jgi:probable O-glycosylation ligase (exosortase A-associated)
MIDMSISYYVALDPVVASEPWSRNMKTLLLALAVMGLISNRVRVHGLIWVIVVSLGYFGLKGGAYVIIHGGSGHVQGPAGTILADNNQLGLALVMVLPLINYLFRYSAVKVVRLSLVGMAVLVGLAILGTYSRGALIALVMVGSYFWWQSKRKFTYMVIGAALMIPAIAFMPDQWVKRMHSIETYEEDSSSMGRIVAWQFALRVAKDRPFVGGGFDATKVRSINDRYYPGRIPLAAHSNWFQVIGDLGFVGFLIYVAIGGFTWLTASRVRRTASALPDYAWAADLATMLQLSLVGYFAGGSFLSMAYYDVFYALVAIVAALRQMVPRPARKAMPRATARPSQGAALPARARLPQAGVRTLPAASSAHEEPRSRDASMRA